MKMSMYFCLLVMVFLVLDNTYCSAQRKGAVHRVMFYNVENFFDPFDDSLSRDEEFTSEGSRGWTYERFMEKAVKIARVIIACAGPEPPVIVGLAEIENRFVLQKLIYETPLNSLGYRIIHADSRDSRGIDVAMIYRKDYLKVDTFVYMPVELEPGNDRTRDILIATCVLNPGDTLIVSINHWPSRYGGAAGSEGKRSAAALQLKKYLLNRFHGEQNLLIMGDFNDEPSDKSLQTLIASEGPEEMGPKIKLINLMSGDILSTVPGTIKHNGFWSYFDQVIVSECLLNGTCGLSIANKKAAVFTAAFLFEADNSHVGMKPKRSYIGPAYHDGFSDHLPVYIDISIP